MDILASFESCHPSVEFLLEIFPVLSTRPYSLIDDCSERLPQELNFAFTMFNLSKESNEENLTCDGVTLKRYNRKTGVATGYMHRMWEEKLWVNSLLDIHVSMRPNLNNFYHPEGAVDPLIMICAGSGITPFIGFLQYRRKLCKENSSRLGETWLIFGCREPCDLLFAEELAHFIENGTITYLCLCFSRFSGSLPSYLPEPIKLKAIIPVGCKYVQDCILSSCSRSAHPIDEDTTDTDLSRRLERICISPTEKRENISSRLTTLMCLQGGHVRVRCFHIFLAFSRLIFSLWSIICLFDGLSNVVG